MGGMPEISVGLPVYNGERYLRVAIESILNQTFTDFELIISDNASTDSTWDICNEYAKNDDRVRLYRQDYNIGALGNFAFVFQRAGAEYFMWMSHDDIVGENCIEACHDFLSTHQHYVLCCPVTIFVDENREELYGLYGCNSAENSTVISRYSQCLDDILLAFGIYGLIRREGLEEIIPKVMDLPLDRYNDHRLVCFIALYGKIKRLEGVHRYFRCHADRSSAKGVGIDRLWRSLRGPTADIPRLPWKNYYVNHARQIIYSSVPVLTKLRLILLVFSDVRVSRIKEDVVNFGRVISIGRPTLNRFLKKIWLAARKINPTR